MYKLIMMIKMIMEMFSTKTRLNNNVFIKIQNIFNFFYTYNFHTNVQMFILKYVALAEV